MNNINQLGAFTAEQVQVNYQGAVSKIGATSTSQASGATDLQTNAEAQVSSLSRLLSDASIRAAERDSSTSRGVLAAIAQSTVEELFSEDYTRNKATYDAEVPDSEDPLRLAQAKQATDFANGKGSNPFKGMSRDQLALIAYDDSGAFTVNERRAALREADDQEYQWRVKIVAKMMDEYNRTGKISSNSYQEVLDHYKSLSAIEQAQYPADYEAQLQVKISLSSSSSTTNGTFLFNTLNNWKNELQETFPISPDESFHPAWQ